MDIIVCFREMGAPTAFPGDSLNYGRLWVSAHESQLQKPEKQHCLSLEGRQ